MDGTLVLIVRRSHALDHNRRRIAEAYEPEALVGRTVVIVFNLKPAKLMGIESNGMVLAASPDGGKPTVVSFDEPPPPGTRVR